MEYISSDTNIWLDFGAIDCLTLPFKLPYTYIMYAATAKSELLRPSDLCDRLVGAGLKLVDITSEEFVLAESYGKYRRLSRADRTALAIAKNRSIMLMTGDKAMRNAALLENVACIGTLGILDELLAEKRITKSAYDNYLLSLKGNKERRLPSNEIDKRLKDC